MDIIAQKAGVSRATAEQYDAIQRKGTEEQKAEVALGNASIKKVYTQIQRAERLANNIIAEWPKDKYQVIYADPPWSYKGGVDHYLKEEVFLLKLKPFP